MCLVVLGGEPLNTLQAWVAHLFNAVPFGRGLRPSFAHVGMPYEVGFLASPCRPQNAWAALSTCMSIKTCQSVELKGSSLTMSGMVRTLLQG